VVNYVEAEAVDPETGASAIEFVPIETDRFIAGEWSQQVEYVFNDGTTDLPRDLPPPDGSDAVHLSLSIGLPLFAAVIMIFATFLFYEHKRKQNNSIWKIEKDDIIYNDPPQVVGRGTFGLVVLGEYRGTHVAVKRVLPDSSAGWAKSQLQVSFSASGQTSTSTGVSSIANRGLLSGGNWSQRVGTRSGFRQSETVTRRRLRNEFMEEMRHLAKLRHPAIIQVMGEFMFS